MRRPDAGIEDGDGDPVATDPLGVEEVGPDQRRVDRVRGLVTVAVPSTVAVVVAAGEPYRAVVVNREARVAVGEHAELCGCQPGGDRMDDLELVGDLAAGGGDLFDHRPDVSPLDDEIAGRLAISGRHHPDRRHDQNAQADSEGASPSHG